MSYIVICHFEYIHKNNRIHEDLILNYSTKQLAEHVRMVIGELEELHCEDIKVFPHLNHDIEKFNLNEVIEYMFGPYMCYHMEFHIHYVPPIII